MLLFLKKLFMSFSAKNTINPPINPPIHPTNSKVIEISRQDVALSKQEIEFLLTLIKNSNFSGSVIEILYNTTYKLQEQHKTKEI